MFWFRNICIDEPWLYCSLVHKLFDQKGYKSKLIRKKTIITTLEGKENHYYTTILNHIVVPNSSNTLIFILSLTLVKRGI